MNLNFIKNNVYNFFVVVVLVFALGMIVETFTGNDSYNDSTITTVDTLGHEAFAQAEQEVLATYYATYQATKNHDDIVELNTKIYYRFIELPPYYITDTKLRNFLLFIREQEARK